MVKVYFRSTHTGNSESQKVAQGLSISSEAMRATIQLVSNPETADVIILADAHPGNDMFVLRALRDPVRRANRERCVQYHDSDTAFPIMRGLYPSILREHLRSGSAGAPYFGRSCENPEISKAVQKKPALTACFSGSNNSRSRELLFKMSWEGFLLEDTSGKSSWLMMAAERHAFQKHFAETLASSKFVLCPGGIGPSSYRLYEAMEIGRCPVIISDDWCEPPGVPWPDFSIRVAENRISDIPNILASHDYESLGAAARQAFADHCTPEASAGWLVEQALKLLESPPPFQSDLRAIAALLKSTHGSKQFRLWGRNLKRKLPKGRRS